MLKMNLQTNTDNLNYLRYMEQEQEEKENDELKSNFVREQTWINHFSSPK